MKKLIAILLSVLMLCSVIPFAAVSAANDHYIEIVADAEEVNAGDEVTIEVSLYGHEELGLIGTQIELGFDHDVFELVTTYDEDEEMWMPPIEVGPKFSASSNKYIMFPPIDDETGYMERCLVQFLRPTASASQAVKTNLFYTVTFKVKDDAPSGTYEIDFINYHKKNIICIGNEVYDWTWEPAVITVNGTEPPCEHEYANACDKVCALCGKETRPEAEHKYANAHDVSCDVCGAVRDLVLAADEVILFNGNSVSEIKNGLAFKFDAAINGVVIGEDYVADYDNATVTINGVKYKLIEMGAIVNNKGLSSQTVADTDNKYVRKVQAVKAYNDEKDATSYAVRVVNIPAEKLDAEIIARPYFVYEDGNGNRLFIYGEDQVASFKEVKERVN